MFCVKQWNMLNITRQEVEYYKHLMPKQQFSNQWNQTKAINDFMTSALNLFGQTIKIQI